MQRRPLPIRAIIITGKTGPLPFIGAAISREYFTVYFLMIPQKINQPVKKKQNILRMKLFRACNDTGTFFSMC